MPRSQHYVPEIRLFIVSALYHEAQHQKLPMTELVNQLLEGSLKGSVGWQRRTPGSQSVYIWLDLPTAHQLGLPYWASTIFGFRGGVELFEQPPTGSKHSGAVDAVDVSEIHWFRIEPLFLLD